MEISASVWFTSEIDAFWARAASTSTRVAVSTIVRSNAFTCRHNRLRWSLRY